MIDVKSIREHLELKTGLQLWIDDISYSYKLVAHNIEDDRIVAEFIHNNHPSTFGRYVMYDDTI